MPSKRKKTDRSHKDNPEELLIYLRERNKELSCLHSVSHLCATVDQIPELLQKVVDIIPDAFFTPEKMSACITYNNDRYYSSDYSESDHVLEARSESRSANGHLVIRATYKSNAEPNNPVFLDEEQTLLRSLSDTIFTTCQRIQTNLQIEYERMRYALITNATFDAIWDWDLKNDTVYWNPGLTQLFGHKIETLPTDSTSWTSFIHPEDVDRVHESILNVINGTASNWIEEYRYRKADGTYAIVMDRGSVLRDANGKAFRMAGAMQDITVQKLNDQYESYKTRISELFRNNEDISTCLKSVFAELSGAGSHKITEIWLLSIDHSYLNLRYSDNMDFSRLATTDTTFIRFNKSKGLPWIALKNGTTYIETNLEQSSHFQRKEHIRSHGVSAAVLVPIASGKEAIGCISLFYENKDDIDHRFVDLLEKLVDHLGSELMRKLAEEDLKRFFDLSPDVLCIAGTDGYFKKVNPAFCEKIGYSEQEMLSRPFVDFIHEDFKKLTMQEVEKQTRGLFTYNFENIYVSKTGKNIWFSWAATHEMPDGLVFAVGKDITEMKEQSIILDRMYHQSKLGIWSFDVGSGALTVSDVVRDIYEIPKDFDLNVENGVMFYQEGRSRDQITHALNHLISNGEPFDLEVALVTYKNQVKWVRSTGEAEIINGKVSRVFGSIQDIHERILSENKIKELNRELLNQTRELRKINEELEQFAYIASHDLQEPLRMITVFLGQIENKYGDIIDEKGRQYIYFAVNGARKMRQIILDLLEYSKAGQISELLSMTDLNEVVNEAIELNAATIKETRAKIVVDNLPVLNVASGAIKQVFYNLISNSLKYRHSKRTPEIKISCIDEPDHTILCIKDNGIGIEPDYTDKIFVIFQRLHNDRSYSGTGIGLSICKRIIEHHNGTIWVEQSDSNGSEFRFTIHKHLT